MTEARIITDAMIQDAQNMVSFAKPTCPICTMPFEPGARCATDIDLGTCHASCLEGSPVVDLDTGEPIDGPIATFAWEPRND